jgi:GntR family transcriptional regulator / MocR family aminotransferase
VHRCRASVASSAEPEKVHTPLLPWYQARRRDLGDVGPRQSRRTKGAVADLLLAVDPSGSAPLYEQIVTALEDAIAAGHYDERPLPSTRRLAEDLGVSRNTVLSAYDELMGQGLIEAVPRRGLYVSPDAVVRLRASRRPRQDVPRLDWASRLPEPPLVPAPRDLSWQDAPFPFVTGQPDPTLFPVGAWDRAQREALRPATLGDVIGDAGEADDPELVRLLCSDLLPARGIIARPDEVMVTLGSQHALHLLSLVLVGAGTRVLVENPGYPDARATLALGGAELIPGGVDDEGLVVDALPSDLGGADLVYVTPSHQYPTGVTMSPSRREQLLALAAARDAVIVEDDYDPEMTFRGTPSVALRALDDGERVVYLGSLSRTLAPGLRLGYLVAAPELVAALRARSRYVARHAAGPLQRSLAQLIASRDHARHVRRLRTHYRRRYEAMDEAVRRHLPWADHRAPRGGLSRWIAGPPGLDGDELASAARRRGVLLDPGAPYWLGDDPPRHHFRLGYQVIPAERIDEGVRLVAEAVTEVSR